MKYFSFLIVLLILTLYEGKAQTDTLVIKLKDGSVDRIQLSQIKNIKFLDVTAVESEPITEKLAVEGNFPNPFNDETEIVFETARPAAVEISIFNQNGKIIKRIFLPASAVGKNVIKWDCLDEKKIRAANGIYFYEVKVGALVESRKMILIK
jgi:hypothetical protein